MALDSVKQGGVAFVDGRSAFRSKEPVPAHHMQDLVDTDVLEGWTVLIYNASMGEVVMLRSWVASLGGTAVRLTEVSDAEAFIARNAGSRIALVIEARSADLDERIEECLSLRARFPSCPIILLSETFGKNDFSTERMAVCDASLRSPGVAGCLQAGSAGRLVQQCVFHVAPCGPCRGSGREHVVPHRSGPSPGALLKWSRGTPQRASRRYGPVRGEAGRPRSA